MSIPDRSRRDPEIAESLSILAAAGNAALIERNHLLAAENRALLAQNESLLDGAAKRQAMFEEIEALAAERLRTIHAQARHHAAAQARLHVEIVATRNRELALRRRARRRVHPSDLIVVPVIVWERAAARWWALRGTERRHWLLASFALALGFLAVAIVRGY